MISVSEHGCGSHTPACSMYTAHAHNNSTCTLHSYTLHTMSVVLVRLDCSASNPERCSLIPGRMLHPRLFTFIPSLHYLFPRLFTQCLPHSQADYMTFSFIPRKIVCSIIQTSSFARSATCTSSSFALFPNCVRFRCCSPIASASAGAP